MSGNEVSILPIYHQPSTGSRKAPPGPFCSGPNPATLSPNSPSAAASAGPSSLGLSPAALPLPESRASSPTSTTTASRSTEDSNRDSSTTAREHSEAFSTEDVPLPPGYPQLARKMGEIPEVAIFRRFGALNAQNLLYMQAELVDLEKRLRRLQARDAAAPSPRSMYAVNWFWLRNSEDNGEGDDDEQWELMKEIRVKLKEYNEMLIQQMKIVCVDPPGSWDMRHIQRFLVSVDMDHGALTGQDADLWDSEEGGRDDGSNENNNKGTTSRSDLLPLASRHREDFFSSWVTESMSEKWIRLNQKRKPEGRRNNPEDFADKKVLRWTFMFASVLASALPILAIAILYCVQSLKVRLGLIALFNILVSFALAWFTSAKRAEVFAVSATFSAVQVVFVQVGANDTQGVAG